MRLIYITATLPYSGAHEEFFIPEVKELMRQGHRVLIVPRSTAGAITDMDAKTLVTFTIGKPLFSLEIFKSAVHEILRNFSRCLDALRLLFQTRNTELMMKNLLVYPKGLWLAELARDWGAAHIHAHWATTTASMAMIANNVSGIPWSFTAHRGDIVQNNLFDLKVRQASFVRFIFAKGTEMARRNSVSETALVHKARVIFMGVNLPTCSSSLSSKLPSTPVILCPANLIPVKGHKYLLRAMAIGRDRGISCRLEIAGEGELRQELEKQVRDESITDRVAFLGHIPRSRLLKRYNDGEIHILTLPSVDLGNGLHEGIPVSLIEAMSYGIPVISTATGGIPDLLEDNAGLLVPPENPVALADGIERLITDSILRIQIGEAGRKRVADKFAIENVVTNLAENFTSSLNNSRPNMTATTSMIPVNIR